MSALDRLEAAAKAWREADYGGVVEYDAANELYGAALAVLAEATEATPRLEAA